MCVLAICRSNPLCSRCGLDASVTKSGGPSMSAFPHLRRPAALRPLKVYLLRVAHACLGRNYCACSRKAHAAWEWRPRVSFFFPYVRSFVHPAARQPEDLSLVGTISTATDSCRVPRHSKTQPRGKQRVKEKATEYAKKHASQLIDRLDSVWVSPVGFPASGIGCMTSQFPSPRACSASSQR